MNKAEFLRYKKGSPEIVKGIRIPPSFALVKKGKMSLLLRDDDKDLLLQQGIEDVEGFLGRRQSIAKHLEGRTPHPCVPLRSNEWMVVRRYSHGGLFRGLTRDLFVFGSRSFRELVL